MLVLLVKIHFETEGSSEWSPLKSLINECHKSEIFHYQIIMEIINTRNDFNTLYLLLCKVLKFFS